MLSEHIQIKKCYEIEGMSPSEIAQDRELKIVAVKAALMHCSAKYRKDCGQEEEEEDTLNFSNDQMRQAIKVIFETSLSAEHSDGSIDYKTRLAAATYVRDDKKGRKEVVRAIANNNTFNILAFNEQISAARARVEDMKRKMLSPALDV